jgi:DNA modification methylase
MEVNKLILGDNLEILKTLENESVDLIYLDPPFFSNRNYEIIWGDAGEVRSFQDRWSGGIDHYIAWLNERVKQMHRILKPTGSIFLHCDYHANAYIRVLILDKIFGENNFQDEIVWHYDVGNAPKNNYKKKHDTIFRYSKDKSCTFYLPLVDPLNVSRYNQIDEKGRKYFTRGDSGKKCYADEGVPCDDVWTFVREQILRTLNSQAKERIGYPTQKPEALLERIIKCASNEGDIVLDPFMGGGTTVAVADRLNRKWIGIDQSVQAVKVTELRLHKLNDGNLFGAPFTVQLHKYDYDTLRYGNAFEFESWIVQQFGGTSNTKQRGDFGLDGKMPDYTPIQVKRSDQVGRNVIDNFFAAIQRSDKKLFDKNISEQKPVGYIIAFSFGKGAIQEMARLQNEESIIIKLVTVEDIVPIAKKPTLTVEMSELLRDAKGICEIEFTALGQSEAGIEFYSWDFDHDTEKGFRATVIIDKLGKQCTQFKAGMYVIAVKVVDNDGLESVEIIKLKINGKVKRQRIT